jgi:putative PIN family toxin of toxin-antitoxin system
MSVLRPSLPAPDIGINYSGIVFNHWSTLGGGGRLAFIPELKHLGFPARRVIKHGKPRILWNAVLDGKVKLVVSEEILEEFIRVASRPKIAKYLDKTDVDNFLKILLQKAELVNTEEPLNLVKDPSDNMILETAVAGGARYCFRR